MSNSQWFDDQSRGDHAMREWSRETQTLRAALRGLLLSRDASWTGGHDWAEAVGDAVRALGIEESK